MIQELEIKETCSTCSGTGTQPLPPPGGGSLSCFMCQGTGKRKTTTVFLDPGLDEILAKEEEVKTKVNQMQADINQIKARVDQIWDKVK